MLNILLFFVITTVLVQGAFTISWITKYGLKFGEQKDLCSYSENFWLHQVFIIALFLVITLFYLLPLNVFIIAYLVAASINLRLLGWLNKRLKKDYGSDRYEQIKHPYYAAFIPLVGTVFCLLELNEEYRRIERQLDGSKFTLPNFSK